MLEPKNILIIRLSAIGDVVFSAPLIKALRHRYPNARITWLLEPAQAPLLTHHPELDQVLVWRKQQWKKLWQERAFVRLWREFRSFKQMLQAQQFDWVIDLQGLLKSGWLASLSRAPRRTGLGSKEGSARFMTEVIDRKGQHPRIASEYYFLAESLGLDVHQFEMGLTVDPDAVDFARQFKASHGGYIVIAPFTTRPQKHWFEASWSSLSQKMAQQFHLPVVLLGGPADSAAAASLLAQNSAIICLVGQTSLAQSAALIEGAALLVGVDTGLTHMGITYHVPTVALFGSTCPYSDTTRDNARVIYHHYDCSPCRRRPTCGHRFDCMAAISVEEVLATAQTVLGT